MAELRLFKIAIRRQVPQALRDARDAAFVHARDEAIPNLAAAFDKETYFTVQGKKAELGLVTAEWQEFKESQGFDDRRGHMTNALARAIASKKKTLKKTGGRKGGDGVLKKPRFSYSFLRALPRDDRARAEGYAATKAPGLGMFSEHDIGEMKRKAIAAFIKRMSLILRSAGLPGSRLVERRRRSRR